MMKRFRKSEAVVIRSWPKVIFLYPVMVTCFICGIWQQFIMGGETTYSPAAGMIFFAVLGLNLLVISFEFSRFRTMSLVFFLIALAFLLLYLSQDWPVWDYLKRIVGNRDINASTAFYFALGTYLLITLACVYVSTRFNYWVIKSNEILHKEGFLGDVRRYPSPNLRMSKEINDVFEFLLLGAGRMILFPASEKQAIVLEHVLRVNAAERAIQELLSSIAVEIHSDSDSDEEGANIGMGT